MRYPERRAGLGPVPILCLLVACWESSGAEAIENRVEPRTLQRIQQRGELRVAVRFDPAAHFDLDHWLPPRHDRQLAMLLAGEMDVRAVFREAETPQEQIELLLKGEVDMIADLHPVDSRWTARVLWSRAYRHDAAWLFSRTGHGFQPDVPRTSQLLQVCLPRTLEFEHLTARLMQAGYRLRVDWLPADTPLEFVLDRVADGRCPAVLGTTRQVDDLRYRRSGLREPQSLLEGIPLSVVVASDAIDLLRWVDAFHFSRALTRHRSDVFKVDLDGLKQRKLIRMITRNRADSYFIHKGSQLGFDYELLKRFAAEHDLRIEVLVPRRADGLFKALREGRGDVVATGLPIPPTNSAIAGVAFTRPIQEVVDMLVLGGGGPLPAIPAPVAAVYGPAPDLPVCAIQCLGPCPRLRVTLRRSSNGFRKLRRISRCVKGLQLEIAPEEISTEELIRQVAMGTCQATVASSRLVAMESGYGPPLEAVPLTDRPTQLAWAVRDADADLLSALNDFIDRMRGGEEFNVLRKRYFGGRQLAGMAHGVLRSDLHGAISPYDQMIKRVAVRFGLDWRLIAAQMFIESRFDPSARSWFGAVGLMQLMPETAAELSVSNPFDVAGSIRGGVAYFAKLMRRFAIDIPLKDRVRFSLAAYNVGYGHLEDARRLARKLGLDPNRWFHNVERAMTLLEKPKFHRQARYGYCRGSQAVTYVSRVQSLYDAFVEHTAKKEGEGS